jgi:hypothetical protein
MKTDKVMASPKKFVGPTKQILNFQALLIGINVYYSTENPNVTMGDQLNQPGVTVSVGFSRKGEIQPIFSTEMLLTACILTC